MRIFFFAALFISNSVYSQQNIVSGSYTYPYQFNLFEKNFYGRVQVISNFSYENHKGSGPDIISYISNKSGLFNAADTSRLNLDDMFEGISFDYKPTSKKFVDESGRYAAMFDTAYKYDSDNIAETILFYPVNNYFIHKQRKNTDTTCMYMTRLFDKGRNVARITYYHNKNKCETKESIATYLSKTSFSEMYELIYFLKGGLKKIARINYYRTDEKTAKKTLYASNKYLYDKNNMVYRAIFEQFNGVSRIKGEITSKYYNDKQAK